MATSTFAINDCQGRDRTVSSAPDRATKNRAYRQGECGGIVEEFLKLRPLRSDLGGKARRTAPKTSRWRKSDGLGVVRFPILLVGSLKSPSTHYKSEEHRGQDDGFVPQQRLPAVDDERSFRNKREHGVTPSKNERTKEITKMRVSCERGPTF